MVNTSFRRPSNQRNTTFFSLSSLFYLYSCSVDFMYFFAVFFFFLLLLSLLLLYSGMYAVSGPHSPRRGEQRSFRSTRRSSALIYSSTAYSPYRSFNLLNYKSLPVNAPIFHYINDPLKLYQVLVVSFGYLH